MSSQTFGIALKPPAHYYGVCNAAQQASVGERTTGMETEACRQRDSEERQAPGAQGARGFHATPQSEKRKRGRRERERERERGGGAHNFTGSPLNRDYEERSCVGQTLPTNSAGLGWVGLGWGRGRRIRPSHKSSLRRSSGARGSSSGSPVRAQWHRAPKRASKCGSMFPEYCATKPDKQLYSIYTCCRRRRRRFQRGQPPTAELAPTLNGVARSERIVPKAPENTERGGGGGEGEEDGTSKWGETQLRAPGEEQTVAQPRTRGATTLQGAVQPPTKKCHSCFLLRCKETRVQVPSELASWLLT